LSTRLVSSATAIISMTDDGKSSGLLARLRLSGWPRCTSSIACVTASLERLVAQRFACDAERRHQRHRSR
jgi:hypothetical protein